MTLTIEGKKFPSPEAVAAYRQLSQTAESLNKASDRLGKIVEKLDTALKDLNLGVQAWVKFNDWSTEDGTWHTDSVGYAKVNNRWGLSIMSEAGDFQAGPDHDSTRVWIFNEAPRELRVQASPHIHLVVPELNRVANLMIEELAKRTEQVDELSLAISIVSMPQPTGLRIPAKSTGGDK